MAVLATVSPASLRRNRFLQEREQQKNGSNEFNHSEFRFAIIAAHFFPRSLTKDFQTRRKARGSRIGAMFAKVRQVWLSSGRRIEELHTRPPPAAEG
ncbi:hypothetical protein FHX15_004651 [Rhizobium sp. BK650]|uniref:hypothetical protein n=1 Tax=Rhizobium sp. BK650 TaxID=2586990 RepID=UPI00161DDABF|nr:hypothetical protein [Rhizobium sp. BK650]MBB3659387.1 hypothetical protein [Rhizobium sp. BK650]